MTGTAPKRFRILAVNPGSTSTKVAVFENQDQVLSETVAHRADDLQHYTRVADQYGMRVAAINAVLAKNGVELSSMDAVVGRGGLLRPMEGGTYEVNALMVEELKASDHGEHASNLGGLIARSLADAGDAPAFIVDPVVVDELDDVARLSGLPDLPRRSIFHALNQKAVARAAAQDLGLPYESLRLVVAHLGGGISVGAHRGGRVVDVNNALDGDGPFAPERAGGLPAGQLAEWCFSGSITMAEIKQKLTGRGGMVAHLGTNDLREVSARIAAGNAHARQVFEAMAYGIAKQIGAMAAALAGRVDAVILTGGLAADKAFVQAIEERIRWIGRVMVIPGEQEMLSLALGAFRVLSGLEKLKSY